MMMNWDINFDISYVPFKEFAHADKLNVILTKNLRIFVIFFFINKKDVKVGVRTIYTCNSHSNEY